MSKNIANIFGALLVGFLAFFLPGRPVQAAPPLNFQRSLIVGSGLTGPTGFDIAPDGRIFLLERTGAVKIYKNGALLEQPFASLPVIATGDRGLIGIAFDPQFSTNHRVYLYYTGTDLFDHLVRFDASGDIGTNGPLELYATNVPSQLLHVGGTVEFGSDGKIYLSIGDNGYPPNAQDLSNPFGKILRLNKDGTIPADNPFVSQPGKLSEIWAYGFRNPFRFQSDQATGQLYEGDVGQDTWEEVNRVVKGADYGWPTCEGICTTPNPNFTDPIFTYNHNGQSRAIAGGPVYRGSMFPAGYIGRYFFGDYAGGFIKDLSFDGSGNVTTVNDFDLSAGSVVDMKQAADGSIYYITYFPGALYRISYSTGNQIPVPNAGADVTHGLNPLTVHFTSAGSFDPDGDALSFLWNFGDNSTSTAAAPTKVYPNPGTYIVQLTVSDGASSAQAVPIVIQVGTPPTLTIGAPTDGSTYIAGDTISYSAHAVDGAGFDLPESAFTTQVLFHHHTHIHPFLGPITSQAGQFSIPTTGEPSADTWFEIQITATDSSGLATTKSVFIFPTKVNLTFFSQPPGLTINLDGQPAVTTQTILSVVGFQRELSAPGSQTVSGLNYGLDHWSDGGDLRHFITTPSSDASYTGFFSVIPPFTGQYFANQTLAGTPVFTRQDNDINFSWGAGSPDPSIPVDHFSVRWTKAQSFSDGTYQFTATADDGVRVYVDGALIIDKWIDQPPTTYNASVALAAGNHDIKMEYYENGGGATAKLSWQFVNSVPPPPPPPAAVQMALVGDPASGPYSLEAKTALAPIDHVDFVADGNLFHTEHFFPYSLFGDDGVTPTKGNISPGIHTIVANVFSTGGLLGSGTITLTEGAPPAPVDSYTGKYWNAGTGPLPAMPTTTPDLLRNDPVINFNWSGGSPDPLIHPDHFIVQWTSQPTLDAATYRFSATADDGIRVFLDDQPIIDHWIDQPATSYTVDVAVTQGAHNLRIEYYEDFTEALAQFSYAKRDVPPPPPPAAVQMALVGDPASGPYSLEAKTALAPIDHVDFVADGNLFHTEHFFPYSLFGDDGVTPTQGNISAGSHTIVANVYSTVGLLGSGTITFTEGAPPAPTPTSTPAFLGEYFANQTLSGSPALTRQDQSVNFNWNLGSPDPLIPVDHFSVRWTNTQTFTAGSHTFTVTADDGVRLYVDGTLLIDKWIDQPATTYTATQSLTAGDHLVKMEYYENGGNAVASLKIQ